MKIYRVGGAVRDQLLDLPVKDIDFVVVGSSPEQMVALGYTPVGKDFPVFLHPHTKAEYALARTERKSAPGYHGFVFHCASDVTIEQDLLRRDLTINAMAIEESEDSTAPVLIDPYGGLRDLSSKIFRHVSLAFAEDPVRILRVARFAARFCQFTVAAETQSLMVDMVNSGEVDALVAERVWQELARGMMESHPSRMFQVLHECGALRKIIPVFEFDSNTDQSATVIDFAALHSDHLAVRFAVAVNCLLHIRDFPTLVSHLKLPTEVKDLARLTLQERNKIANKDRLNAESVMEIFERCDALRRPERFDQILDACALLALQLPAEFEPAQILNAALNAAQSVPTAAIAQQVAQQYPDQPHQIASQIRSARIDAIRMLFIA